MQRIERDAARISDGEALGECTGAEDVCRLGPAVREPRVVRRRAGSRRTHGIQVEGALPAKVGARGEEDDAGLACRPPGRLSQLREEKRRKEEAAEVIHLELGLEAVFREGEGRRHDACKVPQIMYLL